MLLSRKKNKQPAREGEALHQRYAAALAVAILRRQLQAARLLSRRFERLPLWARKGVLLAYSLVMAGASGGLLVQATWAWASADGQALQEVSRFEEGHALPQPQRKATDSLLQSPIYFYPPKKPQEP